MEMGIDQSRDDGPGLQVDDSRLRTGQLAHLGGRAERDDAAITDRERFAHRRLRVDRQDLPVDQDRVRTLRRRRHGGAQRKHRDRE